MPAKQKIIFVLLLALTGLYSCETSKQLPYFKDLPDKDSVTKLNTRPYEPLKLQANDELQVIISSSSPEASHFFNLVGSSQPMEASAVTVSGPTQSLSSAYHVSFAGAITLPVLGDIRVEGRTTDQVKADIMDKLKEYLKDAIVIVRLTNFKVTVIGEVNRPVIVPVNGQTINVLEAIGASGDMTVFGIRRNVKVIRKLTDGNTEVANLDFNKSSVMQSPYFQLKQNDIVYITPNKSKGILGTRSSIWIPIITTLISVTAIILTRK